MALPSSAATAMRAFQYARPSASCDDAVNAHLPPRRGALHGRSGPPVGQLTDQGSATGSLGPRLGEHLEDEVADEIKADDEEHRLRCRCRQGWAAAGGLAPAPAR